MARGDEDNAKVRTDAYDSDNLDRGVVPFIDLIFYLNLIIAYA
jgi:hypothetical protein